MNNPIMPTPINKIEFSEDGAFFTCPVPLLGKLVKFLDAEGAEIFKVESGISPQTGGEVRFVFLYPGAVSLGSSLAEKFWNTLG